MDELEENSFMSSAFDFTDKSVVVTGASRGIGYGVAEAFARHGAEVHILASGEGIFSAGEKLSSKEDIALNPTNVTSATGAKWTRFLA